MMEADRVLRPLYEAGAAIERLETYESPAALLESLRATWHAVDRTLRLLLRHDPGADDAMRLSALSDEMPLDDVITALRRRDLITLYLAGRVHEYGQALRRAESSGVMAADADRALAVVRALETEVSTLARIADTPANDHGARITAEDFPADDRDDLRDFEAPRGTGLLPWPSRRVLLSAAAVVLLVAVAVVMLVMRETDMARGISAFREGQAGVAEQHFRAAAAGDADNVTARLYLGRILRTQGRHEDAARYLGEAARLDPRDPAVLRELGRLFLDLDRPTSAVEQFRMAVELDAEEPLGWVGLVEALRRAGDPSAEEWSRRAPASAQAMMRVEPR